MYAVEDALRDYFKLEGEYQDRHREDDFSGDELPQKEFEKFLVICEERGGKSLVDEVVKCLKAGHDAIQQLRHAACYSSRKR